MMMGKGADNSSNFVFTFTFFLQDLTDLLLKGVQATQFCSEKMMAGTPVGDAFK